MDRFVPDASCRGQDCETLQGRAGYEVKPRSSGDSCKDCKCDRPLKICRTYIGSLCGEVVGLEMIRREHPNVVVNDLNVEAIEFGRVRVLGATCISKGESVTKNLVRDDASLV